MNTIIYTLNEPNIIKFYFNSEIPYEITNKNIVIKSDDPFIISSLNKTNAKVLRINIDAPEGLVGNKYKWEHDDFVLNPNYVAPGE